MIRARLLARRARFSIDGDVLLEASALRLPWPLDVDACASGSTSVDISFVHGASCRDNVLLARPLVLVLRDPTTSNDEDGCHHSPITTSPGEIEDQAIFLNSIKKKPSRTQAS